MIPSFRMDRSELDSWPKEHEPILLGTMGS
jgi:hypothetical protein